MSIETEPTFQTALDYIATVFEDDEELAFLLMNCALEAAEINEQQTAILDAEEN